MTDAHEDPTKLDPRLCDETGLDAVSSAFALIACSDSELTETELERYRTIIRDAEACRGLEIDAVERRFHEMTTRLLDDFEDAKRRALEVIGSARGDTELTRRVLSAAQVALVADGQLREIEETMLREICLTLGVDPDDY